MEDTCYLVLPTCAAPFGAALDSTTHVAPFGATNVVGLR